MKALTPATLCAVSAFALVALVNASARADEVTDWTEQMLRANAIAGTSPLNITRSAAIVESAIFDAVNGIEKRYTPIHVAPGAAPGASENAAAAQAAYATLLVLLPAQKAALDARLAVSMSEIGVNESATSIASDSF